MVKEEKEQSKSKETGQEKTKETGQNNPKEKAQEKAKETERSAPKNAMTREERDAALKKKYISFIEALFKAIKVLEPNEKLTDCLAEEADITLFSNIIMGICIGVSEKVFLELKSEKFAKVRVKETVNEALAEYVAKNTSYSEKFKSMDGELQKAKNELDGMKASLNDVILESFETLNMRLNQKEEASVSRFNEIKELIGAIPKDVSESITTALPSSLQEISTVAKDANRPSFLNRKRVQKEERLSALDILKRDVLINPKYSKEQKDFLVSAAADGVKPEILIRVASPEMEISHMEQVIKLYLKEEGI